MFRRDKFDSFMDHFFDERDQYFSTLSDRMNTMYDEMNNTFNRLEDNDVEMKDEEVDSSSQSSKDPSTVQTLNHYESQNQRVYTDANGRRHYYERRIENVPDKDNHFKVVTTKRIIPKGKSVKDVKQLKDTEKKQNAQNANDDDIVENITEEVVEGLPDHHMEMLDNWYGRTRIGDESKKSIEGKKKNEPNSEKTGKQVQQQSNDSIANDENKKQQHIESLKNEFDEHFKHIENQFENMRNNVFKKLTSDSFF